MQYWRQQQRKEYRIFQSLLSSGATYLVETSKDIVYTEKPSYDPLTAVLKPTWTFYRCKGKNLECLIKATFCLRLYSVSEIVEMVGQAGWEPEAVYGDIYDLEKRFEPISPSQHSV